MHQATFHSTGLVPEQSGTCTNSTARMSRSRWTASPPNANVASQHEMSTWPPYLMPSPVSEVKLQRLNAVSHSEFVAALEGVCEHSPWVAERVSAQRPFASIRDLHMAMCTCVRSASLELKLALIRAHPELAGKESRSGLLTPASTTEQGRLGLDKLNPDEFSRLAALNRNYRHLFEFPCIIALGLHRTRETVYAEFEQRLGNNCTTEVGIALVQIEHIMRGRLVRQFDVDDL